MAPDQTMCISRMYIPLKSNTSQVPVAFSIRVSYQYFEILLCFSLCLCIGKFYFVLKKIIEYIEISLCSKKRFKPVL